MNEKNVFLALYQHRIRTKSVKFVAIFWYHELTLPAFLSPFLYLHHVCLLFSFILLFFVAVVVCCFLTVYVCSFFSSLIYICCGILLKWLRAHCVKSIRVYVSRFFFVSAHSFVHISFCTFLRPHTSAATASSSSTSSLYLFFVFALTFVTRRNQHIAYDLNFARDTYILTSQTG